MCGIIAYNGNRKVVPILVEGLGRLEYRGYDSAGICVARNNQLKVVKRKGEVSELKREVERADLTGSLGIAHTRWATHGEPNHSNAHPHLDCSGQIAIVHNGIIENYKALKKMLCERGHEFRSETDSEVVAHLIEDFLCLAGKEKSNLSSPFSSSPIPTCRESEEREIKKEEISYCGFSPDQVGIETDQDSLPLKQATCSALKCIEGTFGLAVAFAGSDKIIAARRGSPLLLGIGENEMFVASDASAILEHTNDVVYLEENEVAVISKDDYQVRDFEGNHVSKKVKEIQWSLEQIEKNNYKYFMHKEIFEQPEAVRNNLRGRLRENEIKLSVDIDFSHLKKIVVSACGTSWHAALIGKYLIESLCRIPVEVDYASELRYRNPVFDEGTLFIAISQSGETADTLAALREAKQKGAQTLGIVNVVGSTIAREVDSGIYLHAGPEIGVASTKAFTTEISSLVLLSLYLRDLVGVDKGPADSPKPGFKTGPKAWLLSSAGPGLHKELHSIPSKMQTVLENTSPIMEVSKRFKDAHDFLFLARGINFPIALEGALKLKELSYAHAEGYPAGEMKHGPIALIEKGTPVVFIATTSETLEKTISNMEEVRARGGELIVVVDEESREKVGDLAQQKFLVPKTLELLSPLLNVLPLQLLSYYIADLRGLNIDKPRNLAKSVTVE